MSASSKKKLRKEEATAELTEKQLAEKKESRKMKVYTTIFTAVLILILVVALGTFAYKGIRSSGIMDRRTVALTVGDHDITSAELDYFYVDAINDTYRKWTDSFGDQTGFVLRFQYNLDLSRPLSQQIQDESTNKTWADYFVDMAVENAKSTYGLIDEATANGFALPEDQIENIDTTLDNMEVMATKIQGFKNMKAFLKSRYGNGAQEDSFRTYCIDTAMAAAYDAKYVGDLSYTADDIKNYDNENAADMNVYSYSTYFVPVDKFMPEGTKDEEGNVTYTDEETAEAEAAAKKASEDLITRCEGQFKVLHSSDPKNLTSRVMDACISLMDINKGLQDEKSTYTENKMGSGISDPLHDWITDSSRKLGDITLIPRTASKYNEAGELEEFLAGYYVVAFESVGDNRISLPDVRHILFKFEGGTTDTQGNTTYTDEEKAAAKEKAEQALADWKAGEATEDSFAAMATEKSQDPGSAENGGLYTAILPGQMIETFDAWCFDEARKAGDTGIVETPYGYHVMFYSAAGDTNYRDYLIERQLRSDDAQQWFTDLMARTQAEVKNTSYLQRDIMISNPNQM